MTKTRYEISREREREDYRERMDELIMEERLMDAREILEEMKKARGDED